MSRAEALRAAAARLEAAGVPDAARDARTLLRWASGLSPAEFSAALRETPGAAEADRFADAIARRAARTPVSHILGRREFWGRAFLVGPEALDPRPETETLVAWALEGPRPARVADLGVGTGCILLTLLAEWPDAEGVGVDVSPAALALAARNAAALGVADRARLAPGDWLAGLDGPFDLIVSNPPYLSDDDMAAIPPELAHEPRLALHGGADGLDAYRAIAAGAPAALAPGGTVLLEVGAGQAGAVAALLAAAGLSDVATRADLDGRPRIVGARLG